MTVIGPMFNGSHPNGAVNTPSGLVIVTETPRALSLDALWTVDYFLQLTSVDYSAVCLHTDETRNTIQPIQLSGRRAKLHILSCLAGPPVLQRK
ncbi:hypothetical protein BDM02DRAFT_3118202 [Thelephora ganbajun]|uniref:Uncharacterized protein n=1 Tax=Thelephora ganbajun TaxID=370292 RepID=A0ACB6ZAV4_THEGA|nr:hypothetical protein BDM02DRAFT_3118202 [Thelephora ganbajun]